MTQIEDYLREHREQFEQELFELLSIPSVSTDERHRLDVERAGRWIADQFRELGLLTDVIVTDGHPIIYAESPPVEGKPCALVYGHYDVQPPDPLDEWISPPFEPQIRDGNVYARGATDDKGQMLTHLKSAEAWIKSQGQLPMQLKFLIEGEEEVGSKHLYSFLEAEAERLQCDVVVISDSSQFAPGRPAITYGLKGIAYFELQLQGPAQDLHSGTFGGAVTNPANALARILAALSDEHGRVQVPGFYDDVIKLQDRERQQFADLPFDELRFMERLGVQGLTGEEGYTTLERRWARPTYDINGLTSGYQGQGAKTVLPARASAKFSFRLVPDQDPAQIAASLREFIDSLCPPGIVAELRELHSAPGVVMQLDSPYMDAAAAAIEHGFGHPPVFIREGGSIPIVTALKQQLGVDSLLLGWGLDDDNTHSPNEKFCLADFHRGIKASARLWYALSRVEPPASSA